MLKDKKYYVNGEEKTFKYETDVSFLGMVTLIESIAGGIINDDSYKPYLRDYLIELNVISYFTDIVIPEDMDECYRMVMDKCVYTALKETELCSSIIFIEKNVDEIVDYHKKESSVSRKINKMLDAFIKFANTATNNVDNLTPENIDGILSRLENIGVRSDMNEEEVVGSILKFIGNKQSQEDKEEE